MNAFTKLAAVLVLFSCGRDVVVGRPEPTLGGGAGGSGGSAGGGSTGGGSAGGVAAGGGSAGGVAAGGGSGGGAPVVNHARIGVFRDGRWTLDTNGDGTWQPGSDVSFTFGVAGDRPVTGDWTGDGRMKVGIFRNVGGVGYWQLDLNGNNAWDGPTVDREIYFGQGGNLPVVGDWTHTGVWRIGVYRASDTTWSLDLDGDGAWNATVDRAISFGYASSQPVAGDWTGSGLTRVGVMTPAMPNNAFWSLDMNGNGTWDQGVDRSISFGLKADVAIVGDWNGDGATKLGVFRGGEWSFDRDGDGVYDSSTTFGGPGDLPVAF